MLFKRVLVRFIFKKSEILGLFGISSTKVCKIGACSLKIFLFKSNGLAKTKESLNKKIRRAFFLFLVVT